jgi:DeoR/GlpR family transcriptional regulator of sugar metabolism
MFVEERQNLIVEELEENGKVLVKDLSKRFDVTCDLIRKDLNALEKKGKCKKIYGGAILNRENVHLLNANSRKSVHVEKKMELAKLAYDVIKDDTIVFLDISTTNIELAKLIVSNNKKLTVVTNMLDIAQILANSTVSTIFIGGQFDKGRNGFVGNLTDDFIQRFHFDLAFLGVVGLDIEKNSVMTYMADDGQTKRVILNQTKEAFMICESEKFYQSGNYKYAKIDDFYGIITDKDSKGLKNYNVEVIKTNKKQ